MPMSEQGSLALKGKSRPQSRQVRIRSRSPSWETIGADGKRAGYVTWRSLVAEVLVGVLSHLASCVRRLSRMSVLLSHAGSADR